MWLIRNREGALRLRERESEPCRPLTAPPRALIDGWMAAAGEKSLSCCAAVRLCSRPLQNRLPTKPPAPPPVAPGGSCHHEAPPEPNGHLRPSLEQALRRRGRGVGGTASERCRFCALRGPDLWLGLPCAAARRGASRLANAGLSPVDPQSSTAGKLGLSLVGTRGDAGCRSLGVRHQALLRASVSLPRSLSSLPDCKPLGSETCLFSTVKSSA